MPHPLLEDHRARGARLIARPEAPDSESVLTFGDVPAEYAAAREGCVVLDQTDRGAVRAGGPDAATFLHRLLANRVRELGPDEGNRNLLLSAKGKVLFDLDLLPVEAGFELSTTPGRAEALREALDVFHFAEDLELSVTTDEHAPLELLGPRARAVLEGALGVDLALEPGRVTTVGDRMRVSRKDVAGTDGYRVDAGPERARELWNGLVAAGATPAGIAVRDMVRVEECAALEGVDVDEGVYPQEARLEAAFDLEKGCYVGQEVVAKIDTYGGLNKRLMMLAIAPDEPVPHGTRLTLAEDGEQRDLGLVTSWAYSFARDGGLALGYVKRRHQEPGTRFAVGETGATATIVER